MSKPIEQERDLLSYLQNISSNMKFVLDDKKIKQLDIAEASLGEDGKALSQKSVSNLKNAVTNTPPTLTSISLAARSISRVFEVKVTLVDMLTAGAVKGIIENSGVPKQIAEGQYFHKAIEFLCKVNSLTNDDIDRIYDALELLGMDNIAMAQDALISADTTGDMSAAIIKLADFRKTGS